MFCNWRVEVVRAVPGPDVAQGAELRMALQAGRQAAISGMVIPGPAGEVAPGGAMALEPPHDLDARPVRHCEAGPAAPVPDLQPVRGIEEPADIAGAGLGDVETERRPGQRGHGSGPVARGVGNPAWRRRGPGGVCAGTVRRDAARGRSGRRQVPEARQGGLPARVHGLGVVQEFGVLTAPGVALVTAHQQVFGIVGPVNSPAGA